MLTLIIFTLPIYLQIHFAKEMSVTSFKTGFTMVISQCLLQAARDADVVCFHWVSRISSKLAELLWSYMFDKSKKQNYIEVSKACLKLTDLDWSKK